MVLGASDDASAGAALQRRCLGYMENLQRKAGSPEEKALYKNLPKEYHGFVAEGIRGSQAGGSAGLE